MDGRDRRDKPEQHERGGQMRIGGAGVCCEGPIFFGAILERCPARGGFTASCRDRRRDHAAIISYPRVATALAPAGRWRRRR